MEPAPAVSAPPSPGAGAVRRSSSRTGLAPRWGIRLALLSAGILAWSGALEAPFLFDDVRDILSNPRVWSLSPLSRPLGGTPRPVWALSIALDFSRAGPDPRAFHVTNLAIHLAAGLLLFELVRRTLRRVPGSRVAELEADGAAGLVTLIWLLHPLHSTVVAYAVHRTESLMGLFFLATLVLLSVAVDAVRPEPWLACSAVCCALGMATKETMVFAPIIALLWDRALAAGSFREALRSRRWYYTGLATTWLLLPWLGRQNRVVTAGFGFADLTPWDYLRTQAGVLTRYLRLTIWPSSLSVDYNDWPVARQPAGWVPAGLFVLALLALALYAAARKPALGFVALSPFLVLAPTSTVLPLRGELLAERRMYLPLAALVALVIVGAARLLRAHRVIFAAFALGLAVAAGLVTAARCDDFQTAERLWRDTVKKRPLNSRAWNELGNLQADQGRFLEAEASYREAVRLGFVQAGGNLAMVLVKQGHLLEAETAMAAAYAASPVSAALDYQYAVLHEARGRYALAIASYRKALTRDPDDLAAVHDLAWLLATTPDRGLRRPEEAVALMRRSIARTGKANATQLDILATALAAAGRLDEAVRTENAALLAARRENDTALVADIERRMAGLPRRP